MMPEPPGTVRAIRLIAGAAVRRRVNRIRGNIAAAFNKKKKGGQSAAEPQKRTGTGKKGGSGAAVLLLIGGIFLFNGINISTQFMRRLAERIDFQNSFVVHDFVYGQIKLTEQTLKDLDALPPNAPNRAEFRKNPLNQLKKSFIEDMTRNAIPESEQPALAAKMMEHFDKKGANGFRMMPQREGVFYPSTELWTLPENRLDMLSALGATFFLVAVALFFMTIGNLNQDLGKVEWGMEWFFTFPLPARTLFLARIFEHALSNPLMWFVTYPFTLVVFWCAGFSAWSFLIALAVTFYFGLLLASAHVFGETWLRKKMALNNLKNFQAVFTLLGTVLFFAMIAVVSAPSAMTYLLRVAESISQSALWNPLSAPILLCAGTSAVWGAMGAMAGFAFVFPFISVQLSQWLVRDGLLGTSGTYTGTRGRATAAEPSGGFRLRGIVGKELRLLFRDRNFLVQTLVVPVLGLAFQVIMSPGILKGAVGDLRHASTMAFGLGAYVLMFSAFQVLAVEGTALWMLYTFPRDVSTVLLKKTALWCGFASLYTVTVLLACAIANPALNWEAISPVLTALVGVVIYSYIASGIGVLGTDPLETEVQRKIRPEMMYLYMLLVSMFAWAIYNPSLWAKLAQIILSTLLAGALWQKVRDRAPYMLDPTVEPPPTIDLSDGMIAVLAFSVLQGLIGIILAQTGLPLGAQILIGFVSAGALVALFALYTFWRQKVPNILASVGLRSAPGEKPSSLKALLLGIGGGLCAAAFALGYLWMATWFEPLKQLKAESLKLVMKSEPNLYWWIAGLAVFAAPLFEEFIFRGLVYKGLRRSVKPYVAVLASAGVFAIVHPPLSVIPVFVLGISAAICFERSRLLLAPIAAHMVYNAIVLAAQ